MGEWNCGRPHKGPDAPMGRARALAVQVARTPGTLTVKNCTRLLTWKLGDTWEWTDPDN